MSKRVRLKYNKYITSYRYINSRKLFISKKIDMEYYRIARLPIDTNISTSLSMGN